MAAIVRGSVYPRSIQLLGVIVSVAAVFVVAALGGGAVQSAPERYQQLNQPDWAPPAWLFGPVWTALYIVMAVAVWLVWRSGPWRQTRFAIFAYGVQLLLNAAWTPLFFGLSMRGAALADIIVLDVLIVVTMVLFWCHQKLPAIMLIPYLLWSLFATGLSYAVWSLN